MLKEYEKMNDYNNYKHSELTGKIINAAYEVHSKLGLGFLESVYEKSLAIELKKMHIEALRQFPIAVYYDEELVGDFRADLLVEHSVIVELKAVEILHPIHEVQLVNYLRATEIEVGLLINFGEKVDIKRRVFSNERKTNLPTT